MEQAAAAVLHNDIAGAKRGVMVQAVEKESQTVSFRQTGKMPALFVGHGNPMNAIEDNEFSRAWIKAGQSLPRPEAVLCVSAHWQTDGTRATAMPRPKTIHDFYGFPRPLYEVQYPAPGWPEMMGRLERLLRTTTVRPDPDWGLDHGSWSVLRRMFPQADIPVVQLSLDYAQPPGMHYELGRQLKGLRNEGVLIVGSGNVVHNLGVMEWQDTAFDWALEMDQLIAERIAARDHRPLIEYDRLGPSARMAVPTSEHYLPLLYVLALQDDDDGIEFFAEKVTLGSVSMRSLRVG
jgi:4,5-DOPA dioxygenase extradiol